MILRSLTEHVRTQNWFAVGLDFLIVVVGVFIGIQVSNWNAARLERVIERDTLIRLYADFQESIAGLDRDLRFLEQQLADQQVVIRSLDACDVAPEADAIFQRGVVTLGFVNRPRLYRRTIDEIAASGRTDIIQNTVLADELAGIVAHAEWRADSHDQVVLIIETHKHHIESYLRYTLEVTFPDAFIPNHRGGVTHDIKAMCADPQVANSVSAISYVTHERLEAHRALLERYKRFAPEITEELASRWGVEIGANARSTAQDGIKP
ncbi:MAG: hypothetical protein AAF511_02935 [Pseudomonadota bacterium]